MSTSYRIDCECTIAAYRRTHGPRIWIGSRFALLYIHQVNWVNSRNDFVMMTAPQTLSRVLVLVLVLVLLLLQLLLLLVVCIRCRELTVLLQLTCVALSGDTSWRTSRGLLLDAIQRLYDVNKPVLTTAEQISVRR